MRGKLTSWWSICEQAIAGFSYLAYSFLNKDSDPGSGGGAEEKGSGSSGRGRNSDDSLEEARRIMEKYK